MFLFAVARDVQRNPTPSGTASDQHKRCPFAHPTSWTTSPTRFHPSVTAFAQVRALHTRGGYPLVANPPRNGSLAGLERRASGAPMGRWVRARHTGSSVSHPPERRRRAICRHPPRNA